MEVIYTAEVLSSGEGRNGHVSTPDGHIDLELAEPVSMGSSGEGANPEQLFAAAHEVYRYSNAARGNIDVTIAVSDD